MLLEKKQKWMIIFALSSALFMEFLDATALNTSLPRIAHDFSLNPLYLKIAITSYLLSVGLLLPLSSFLAQRVGMKRLYMLANVIFMLGSIGCGFAQGVISLTVFRVIQGVGGAFLGPVYRLMMVNIYSKEDLPQVQSTVALIVSLGLVLGPLFGGFLTTYLSWRFIFWVNVPVVLLTLLISYKYLPEFAKSGKKSLDFLGFILLAMALVCLLALFDFLPNPAITLVQKILLLAVALIAGIAYVFCSLYGSNPLFARRFWSHPSLLAVLASSFLARLGFNAIPFLIPLMLQVGFSYSPVQAGLMMLAVAAGVLLAKALNAQLAKRFNRLLLTRVFCGILSIVILGFALLANYFSWPLLFVLLIVFGALQGTIATCMNVSIYVRAPVELLNDAVVLNSMSTQLSGSFAVAIAAAFMMFYVGLDALSAQHIPLLAFKWVFIFEAVFPLVSMFLLWRLINKVTHTTTV